MIENGEELAAKENTTAKNQEERRKMQLKDVAVVWKFIIFFLFFLNWLWPLHGLMSFMNFIFLRTTLLSLFSFPHPIIFSD